MNSTSSPTRSGLTSALSVLWREMEPGRRRQFVGVLGLMLVGMIAELMTIGAVIPFLIVISDPSRAARLPLLGDLAQVFGARDTFGLMLTATGLLMLAAIGSALARILVLWATLRFVMRLSHDIGIRIFGRMLRQPYSHFVMRNTSELIAGMEKVQAVIWGALMPGMQGFIAAATALAIMGLLIAIDPLTASLAAAAMIGAFVIVSLVVRKRLARNSEQLAHAATYRVQNIQEGLGGIRDILLDQSQEMFEEKYRVLDIAYRRAQAVNNLIFASPRYVIEATGIVLIAALSLYLSFQPGGIVAALPTLGALALGAQRLLPMLQQAYNGWSSVLGNRQLVLDVVELMMMPILADARHDPARPALSFDRSLQFDRVGFRYPSGSFALCDIDLTVRRGSSIGFVGLTGSGKSTLLDLAMGLLEPTDGIIRVDGTPLTHASRADWQRLIAHVPQAIFLADSSIAANIAFGQDAGDIDEERLKRAARMAQIDEWVSDLDQGYGTPVGERGLRLSGGQRQRIGIARAIYKGAPVLIFDEATSALDSATERKIIEAIGAAREDLTLLMIAHRTSTLAGCDLVVRLDQGRIVETGTFAQVVGTTA